MAGDFKRALSFQEFVNYNCIYLNWNRFDIVIFICLLQLPITLSGYRSVIPNVCVIFIDTCTWMYMPSCIFEVVIWHDAWFTGLSLCVYLSVRVCISIYVYVSAGVGVCVKSEVHSSATIKYSVLDFFLYCNRYLLQFFRLTTTQLYNAFSFKLLL